MSCGCNEGRNGRPTGGGGGGEIVVQNQYECVMEIDWRDEFTAQGAVDLNSSGATLTDQAGATWQTPSVATGPGNQNNGSTAWSLTANGLQVVDCVAGASYGTNANPVTPSLWIDLAAAAAAYGFDGDPTRQWLWQCYVSEQVNDAATNDNSGVAIRKVLSVPAGSGATHGQMLCSVGFVLGSAAAARAFGNVNASTGDVARTTPAGMDVPTVVYAGGTNGWMFAATWAGDWPANSDLRMVAAYSPDNLVTSAIPGDPQEGFRLSMFHQAAATTANYGATIQRSRLCVL